MKRKRFKGLDIGGLRQTSDIKIHPDMTQHFLSSEDSKQFVTTEFLMGRDSAGLSTITKQLQLQIPTKRIWNEFVMEFASKEGFNVQMTGSNGGYVRKSDMIMFYNTGYEGTQIKVTGSPEGVSVMEKILTSRFQEVRCNVTWYYSADGESTQVPLSGEQLPIDEMYPWMDCPLTDYYDKFMQSRSSILLLIGPPGTGKTTWIKGLLHHTQSNALVTYDPAILNKDFVFAEFISGDTNVMVIEDADNFLRSREDGNDLMHKFLNVGSGLISNGNKKLVFSTNLPSILDIDSALLRPGRCYDVLEFQKLTTEQCQTLASKIGVDTDNPVMYNASTVAEVFNQAKTKPAKRSFGFI